MARGRERESVSGDVQQRCRQRRRAAGATGLVGRIRQRPRWVGGRWLGYRVAALAGHAVVCSAVGRRADLPGALPSGSSTEKSALLRSFLSNRRNPWLPLQSLAGRSRCPTMRTARSRWRPSKVARVGGVQRGGSSGDRQATSHNHPYPRRRGDAAADPWVGLGAGCLGAGKARQGPVRAEFRAVGRHVDRLGLLRVGIRAEDHRGARVGQHRHQRGHRRLRLPHARGRPAQRARLLRHERPQLHLSRHARLLQARRLQRAHPAAGRRAPHERQRLRERAPGDRVRLGPRHHRADRNRPRPELVALWHERFLRGDQRHHQEGRGDRRLRCGRQPGQLRHQPRPRELRQGIRQRGAGPALGLRL